LIYFCRVFNYQLNITVVVSSSINTGSDDMLEPFENYILAFAKLASTTSPAEYATYEATFGIVCTAIATEALYKRGWKGGKKTALIVAPICGLLAMGAMIFLMM